MLAVIRHWKKWEQGKGCGGCENVNRKPYKARRLVSEKLRSYKTALYGLNKTRQPYPIFFSVVKCPTACLRQGVSFCLTCPVNNWFNTCSCNGTIYFQVRQWQEEDRNILLLHVHFFQHLIVVLKVLAFWMALNAFEGEEMILNNRRNLRKILTLFSAVQYLLQHSLLMAWLPRRTTKHRPAISQFKMNN